VITSFHGNGELTWTNAPGEHSFVVEWSPNLVDGQWHNSWEDLMLVSTTGTEHTVSVPMFYRVKSDTNDYSSAFSGPWFMYNTAYDPEDEDSMPYGSIIFGGDGSISAYGAFDQGVPAGFYSYLPNGHFCISLLCASRRDHPPDDIDFVVNLTGQLDSPAHGVGEWTFFPPQGARSTFEFAPVPESTCQGDWTGTLVDTNAPPQTNAVAFTVTATGLVTNFTGFTAPVTGHMFADTNSNVYAFFWTGDTGDYTEIKVFGSLTNDSASGVFHLHLGPRGPVNFQRQ